MKSTIPIVCALGAIALASTSAIAGPVAPPPGQAVSHHQHGLGHGALFRDQEFSLAGFALLTASDLSALDSSWGGGVELSYFFDRHVGLAVEGWLLDSSDAVATGPVDLSATLGAINASLVVRMPVEEARLAPYVFGGGGWLFNGSDSFQLHVGGGLEYRLTENFGVFGDGRFVWLDEFSDNYGLFRAGFRVTF